MSEKLFKTIKEALKECNSLPEDAKEILKITKNSINDLDENDSKRLWNLLHDFIKETFEDINDTKDIITCYQCILNLVNHVIKNAKDIICIYEHDHLLKTIMIFQSLYSKNVGYKLKFEIAKLCFNFWQRVLTSQNESNNSFDFDSIMTQNFHFTLNYVFDSIKVTTKKFDMKALSSLLREFCKVMSTMSNNKKGLNLIVLNLEKIIKHTMFLETETGKLTIADVYTTNQQLFLRFHQIVKKNLPKANKLEAEAYGEIYFISWINSNASMREVIEQQGIFDIISKTLVLQRKGSAFRTYHYALIFLQNIQNHRKHLLFSKVITNLYAPILWRQLENENGMIRCNATEILARAYPLEKRGEGREVSSRFLIKQQNTLLDLLVDPCPQVRIAAIRGMCSCLRYFWDSFEEDQIIKCFNLFSRLINESVFEVRRVLFFGFCQLLDESKSHTYFKVSFFMAKMKYALNDENEKVRRAFLHFLLKVKKIDSQLENTDKISFAKIVNLQDTASALAREEEQNIYLLVDLIFDNFIGDKVPDKHATLMRFNMFYKINPVAFRKLIMYSDKNLDFDSAYNLILSLLKTVYNGLKRKEERLKSNDKENSIPAKKRKTNDDSDNMSDTSSSCSSLVSNNEENDHSNVCCILDCVYCLMILHRDTFIKEENHQKMKDIQDSCSLCLIKLLKFYKEGDAYYCAMNLASLIPVSKLTAHVSAPSTALSILRQLPCDVKNAEEKIDMRKVDCLVSTLCMWKRGYEILQFVYIWFDEAFKTLNINETQYPESTMKEGKRVRFKTNIEECKPMTGILLINSMLLNLRTQQTLMDSDINKRNIYDLMTYLQRVKIAIETRISSDNVLSDLLNDEALVELFLLHIRLHVIYHSHEENLCIDEIIKYQTSILDWVINNLIIHDLHHKSEATIKFAAKVIDVINQKVLDMCLMAFVNQSYLDNFFSFCTTVLHNHLGPRVLISLMASLAQISKYYNYLKQIDNPVNDMSTLINCVCSIISTLSETKYDEECFTTIIGEPLKFRRNLIMLVSEIFKMNKVEFKQIFITIIENIMNVIANRIREIDEVDLNVKLTEMPFAAYQLTIVILNNSEIRKQFSSNATLVFSSNIYKKDCFLLLSAISFVFTLSFQLNHAKTMDLEQVVKLLYTILMEFDKSTTPLGNNCTINSIKANPETSVLETSDFNNEIMDFKKKGRNILVDTAKQLRITLTE